MLFHARYLSLCVYTSDAMIDGEVWYGDSRGNRAEKRNYTSQIRCGINNKNFDNDLDVILFPLRMRISLIQWLKLGHMVITYDATVGWSIVSVVSGQNQNGGQLESRLELHIAINIQKLFLNNSPLD